MLTWYFVCTGGIKLRTKGKNSILFQFQLIEIRTSFEKISTLGTCCGIVDIYVNALKNECHMKAHSMRLITHSTKKGKTSSRATVGEINGYSTNCN